MKSKYTVQDVLYYFRFIDLDCQWYDLNGAKSKNIIGFDSDPRGNGNGPYLEIKFYSKYAKILRGTQVTKSDKEKVFLYENYDSASDFADALAFVVNDYFGSFEYVRK